AKYDALIMQSKALYWQGVQVAGGDENNDDKVPVFEKGYNVADQAVQLNGDYAEGYYLYAINLGRWGLAKGKTNALFKLKDLENHTDDALKHDTKAGKSGETYDGYGPDRTYGRMYNQLPFPMKDNSKSLSYLQKAYQGAPEYACNVVYYAETLHDMGQDAKAKSILQQMLKSSPQDYGKKANRVPETIEEFELARTDLSNW
ncbi:MAG: tetratricopeptide repeat protein, partial [Bdellovibrionota bacterium]